VSYFVIGKVWRGTGPSSLNWSGSAQNVRQQRIPRLRKYREPSEPAACDARASPKDSGVAPKSCAMRTEICFYMPKYAWCTAHRAFAMAPR